MISSKPILKVSELLTEMRQLVERSYPEIWVEGELSSLSTPASGHLYFTLKDEQSQLRCVMFRNRAGISRYKPAVGDLVRIRAKMSIYTARGDMQCIVQHIEEAGEGALQRQYEELKKKLAQQGLFSVDSKRTLPSFVKHIAVITSPSGAAVRDILSTLQRRAPGIPVTIYPAVVQGDGAASTLVEAINSVVRHGQCDVIILSRGGGSLEDLWCFNDEALAHAIFDCPIPIVSGVGHEVDTTISDLVADHRAATPTAAAELLSPDRSQLITQLKALAFRLPRLFNRQIQEKAQSVDLSYHQLVHPAEQLKRHRLAVGQMSKRLERATQTNAVHKLNRLVQQQQKLSFLNPAKPIQSKQANIQELATRLARAEKIQNQRHLSDVQSMAEQLQLVSPLATLSRGFSISRNSQQQIIRNANQVADQEKISVQLADGTLDCIVDDIRE